MLKVFGGLHVEVKVSLPAGSMSIGQLIPMVGAVKRFEERRMRNGFFVSNDAVRNLVVSCPQFTFMQLAVLDHGYCMLWFGFASLVCF